MEDEYHDGQFQYATASALIEDIIDQYQLRAYVYLESDDFDNVYTSTMIGNEDDEVFDDVKFNALMNLVLDILKDRDEADRNAAIADIYDKINEAIHVDDGDYGKFTDFDEDIG